MTDIKDIQNKELWQLNTEEEILLAKTLSKFALTRELRDIIFMRFLFGYTVKEALTNL